MSKAKESNINIIITTFTELNTIFIPILISIISMKICSIEHDHQTFKFLKANGIDKAFLYRAKTSFLLFSISAIIVFEAIFIIVSCNIYRIDVNISSIVKYIIGCIIASYILSNILLMIALKYKNRAVVLSIGILGGFIGIVISRFNIIKMLIPFGIINVLSPVSVIYNKQTSTLMYIDKQKFIVYILIYFVIGILIYNIFLKLLESEEY